MSDEQRIEQVAETASLYAIGGLPDAEAKKFEMRIQSGCPYCMSELENCQRAVEGVVCAEAPVAPTSALQTRLFEKIGSIRESKPKPETKIVHPEDGEWVERSPGIKIRFLHGRRTMMVRMDAGARLDTHTHAMDEQCLVVEGIVHQADGLIAHPGDYIFMAKGTTHPPLFSETGALFLIAYT